MSSPIAQTPFFTTTIIIIARVRVLSAFIHNIQIHVLLLLLVGDGES